MFGFMQQSLTSALSQSSSKCLDSASPTVLPHLTSFAAHTTTLSKSLNKLLAHQQSKNFFLFRLIQEKFEKVFFAY